MASATIPELIEPGVLFVPSANNFFSIDAGALPNGDDELLCEGSSGNFRAYQPAIAGIHYPAAPSDPFQVIFWGRNMGTGTAATGSNNGRVLVGVWDITANSADNTAAESTTGQAWSVTRSVSSGTGGLVYHRAKGASSRAQVLVVAPSSGLHMFAFLDDGSTAPTARRDGSTSVGTNASAGTTGTPGALTAPYFCIGAYPTGSGWRSETTDVGVSKVSIWNGLSALQDLDDLYNSMISGPPSP